MTHTVMEEKLNMLENNFSKERINTNYSSLMIIMKRI